MTDAAPKIGDVIRCTIKNSFGRHSTRIVRKCDLRLCARECAAGRWVIVDQQPQEKPGPNNESSNQ